MAFRVYPIVRSREVDGNNFEIGREVGDLIHPQMMIEGIGMNHDKGHAFAGDFIINFYAVGGAVGHSQL